MSIGDRLDRLVVEGRSPDGNISARVSDYTEVAVSVRPGALRQYDEERLADQLGRLGLSTWVAYHRARSEAYRQARNLSHDELADAERPSSDPRQQAYERELNAVEAEGVSPWRAIRVRTRGLMKWDVRVEPGAIAELGEQAMVEEMNGAIRDLLADRQRKIIVLKSRYFDLGIPRRWIEAMAELQAENARRRG